MVVYTEHSEIEALENHLKRREQDGRGQYPAKSGETR